MTINQMRVRQRLVTSLRSGLLILSLTGGCCVLLACSTFGKSRGADSGAAHFEGPFDLKLKANSQSGEKIAYFHRSRSTSYEDIEIRRQKEEILEFVSAAGPAKIDANAERFTQVITVDKKEGVANLHDFAMPEPGERLELTTDGKGRVIKAGDYPPNSIFYVPAVSLPEGAVAVGDTWAMRSQWLSLEEMVPYQLDMASILKDVRACGAHKCAEIEISGEVTLQGPLVQMMAFKSLWKGLLTFDIDADTVVWSRVDSEEQFMSGNVRRSVTSCLESSIMEPVDLKISNSAARPCSTLAEPGDIAPIPTSMK